MGSMDPLGCAILAMSWINCTKPQVSLIVPIDGRLADCEALLVEEGYQGLIRRKRLAA